MNPTDLLHEAFPQADTPVEKLQLLAGLAALLVLALAAYLVVRRTGHPLQRLGAVVYSDEPGAPTLLSRDGAVTGRPDMVVRAGLWFRKEHRPVEYKSGQPPRIPYSGHVLQLAAYGLVVEAETGHYPRVGYIVYGGRRLSVRKVRLGYRSRALIQPIVAAIRSGRAYPIGLEADARCGGCRHRGTCPILTLPATRA